MSETLVTNLVDGDDDLAVLHTSEVLDSAADTDGYVQLGSDDFACLADLQRVVCETTIDSSSGGTNGCTENVGEWLEESIERSLVFERTTSANDFAGACQIWSLAFDDGFADPLGRTVLGGVQLDFLGCRVAILGTLVKRCSSHSDEFDSVLGADGGDSIARIDRSNKGVLCLDGHDVRHLRYVEQGGYAREEVLAP